MIESDGDDKHSDDAPSNIEQIESQHLESDKMIMASQNNMSNRKSTLRKNSLDSDDMNREGTELLDSD